MKGDDDGADHVGDRGAHGQDGQAHDRLRDTQVVAKNDGDPYHEKCIWAKCACAGRGVREGGRPSGGARWEGRRGEGGEGRAEQQGAPGRYGVRRASGGERAARGKDR